MGCHKDRTDALDREREHGTRSDVRDRQAHPVMAADAMYDYVVGAEKDERIAITLMAARKERLSPCAAALTERGSRP